MIPNAGCSKYRASEMRINIHILGLSDYTIICEEGPQAGVLSHHCNPKSTFDKVPMAFSAVRDARACDHAS